MVAIAHTSSGGGKHRRDAWHEAGAMLPGQEMAWLARESKVEAERVAERAHHAIDQPPRAVGGRYVCALSGRAAAAPAFKASCSCR
jgi:hypothetical protein